MPAAGLTPLPADELSDWYGTPLSKEHIQKLMVDCVVRVVIGQSNSKAWEALYFRITKIKDGTFWGICQDTYRTMGDGIGLPSSETMTFRREHIVEIPMDKLWQQPKAYMKAIGGLHTG